MGTLALPLSILLLILISVAIVWRAWRANRDARHAEEMAAQRMAERRAEAERRLETEVGAARHRIQREKIRREVNRDPKRVARSLKKMIRDGS